MLTVGMAVEFLKSSIKSAHEMPVEMAAALYKSTLEISDTWTDSGISDDVLNRWTQNIQNGVAPEMEVVRESVAA